AATPPPARGGEAGPRGGPPRGGTPVASPPASRPLPPDGGTTARPGRPPGRPRAEAIVTAVPGLAIGVTTADCGPVLFADETAGVIAVAHAGWRGAATGVLEATIAAMERCGADRARVAVALGPTIRQP